MQVFLLVLLQSQKLKKRLLVFKCFYTCVRLPESSKVNYTFDDFKKWQDEINQKEVSLDEETLKYVKSYLEDLKHVHYCFLLDAQRNNQSAVPYQEGVQLGFNECLKVIDQLIFKNCR